MHAIFFKSISPSNFKTPTVSVVDEKEQNAKIKEGQKVTPSLDHFAGLLDVVRNFKKDGDFGEHNVDEGHHVAFAAGAYVGAGKVTATGKDGLTVEDEKKREHRVHWREVTGHFIPEDHEKSDKTNKEKNKDKNAK